MIPSNVQNHLRRSYDHFRVHAHARAFTAQRLAAAEHVSGRRVAKAVLLWLGDRLAMAVVPAADRVNMSVLEEATGCQAVLATESEFADQFQACAVGAEPPLAIFGVPIFVDDKLMREPVILFPGGTHEDAITVDTAEWAERERVQPISNLGRRSPRALHVV